MGFSDYFLNKLYEQQLAVRRFRLAVAEKSDQELEQMARQAVGLTRQFFGKTMRLFAPLYLSNECVNICKYCGFSRHNPIFRVTLSLDQAEREARHLAAEGFRQVLLVAGEHPKFVSPDYLEQIVRRLLRIIPGIALEVGPMETAEYAPIVEAGAEGLIVYQETYDPDVYAKLHESGPKRDFAWRLDCPERAYAAGFRRLGVGVLFGLAPWQEEAVRLAAHVDYLQRHCWKSAISVSFPRLRPAAGEFTPLTEFSDRNLVQTILAFRIVFPQVSLVLSTRENPALRDKLAALGITLMSAGSHTEPGGYTGAGTEDIHHTERGKRVEISLEQRDKGAAATEQFSIADNRSPSEFAGRLKELGLDPVWKDWEPLN